MRLPHVPLLALLLASAVLEAPAADPPVRFPTTPVAPAPPAPGPAVIATLTPGEAYFVPADAEYVWTVEPKGAVEVVSKKTPFAVFGKRAGAPATDTERTYTDPFLYHVKPVARAGTAVLIGVPKGRPVTDPAEIVVQTLTLGTAPDPSPAPSPEPDVKPVQLWGCVIVEETAAAVAGRGALLADPALAGFMTAKGYHWRIVDKNVQGQDGNPPADVVPELNAAAGKSYPQLFIVDAKGGIVSQTNLPDAAGVVAQLKKFGGK